jgi:hypothetical protein
MPMTREQQVDIVAQSIRLAFLRRQGGKGGREWTAVPDNVREAFRLEARAAIEAYERTAQITCQMTKSESVTI